MSLLPGYLIICTTHMYFSFPTVTLRSLRTVSAPYSSFHSWVSLSARSGWIFPVSAALFVPTRQPRTHTRVIAPRRGQREHTSKRTRRIETAAGFVPRTERRKTNCVTWNHPRGSVVRGGNCKGGQWNSAKAFPLLGKQHARVCLRAASWDATVSPASCPFAHRPGRLSEPVQW